MLFGRLGSNAAALALVKRSPRAFSIYAAVLEKPLPPRFVVLESDITESFLKGSGPGGQKINKTSSAVQLKHLPTGIVVKNQETRSREQNRRNARRLLGERLEELEKGPLARTALKAEKMRKKKQSAAKKSRRKYAKLAEEKMKAGEKAAGAIEDESEVDEDEEYAGPDTQAASGEESPSGGETAGMPNVERFTCDKVVKSEK